MAGNKSGSIRKRKLTARRLRKTVRIMTVLMAVMFIAAAFSAYHHYSTYPGRVDRSSFRVSDNGTDFIEMSWAPARNAASYCVYYRKGGRDDVKKGPWKKAVSKTKSIRLEGLEEGASYYVAVRPDSAEHKGHLSEPRRLVTQSRQAVRAEDNIVKLTGSEPFVVEAEANTALSFKSSDPDVVEVDKDTGKAVVKGSGRAKITVKASESTQFTKAKKTIDVLVLDAEPVSISGSSVRTIYNLDFDNCSTLFHVAGEGGAVAPQGMAYTGSKYIMTFGTSGASRIVSYDLDGSNKEVRVPQKSLGHPNGFTYSPDSGLCYCVRGRSSACVMYDTNDGSYSSRTMAVGCSGIGYDPVRKTLCTSARKSLVVYDPDDYSIIKRTGVVAHSGTVYRQDCCAYDGLMMVCVSGSNMHGTNYIDIYDMENSTYVGTLRCELSEVESVIVNNEGFLEILSNGSSRSDYILRTDINIRGLAKELHSKNSGDDGQ